jgi:hypothetical protein
LESPDWRVDFTTMDNTAALDDATPRILRIAGSQSGSQDEHFVLFVIIYFFDDLIDKKNRCR